MSSDRKPRPPGPRDYEVGYGKPPKEHRFKKGQSGNPRGRPKDAKFSRPAPHEEGLKDIVLEEAYRLITVRDGDRTVAMPMAQAVFRALAVEAAKGKYHVQRLFTEMLSAIERGNRAVRDALVKTAIAYETEWELELERRERLGITDAPPPLPHPDHIEIDLRAGTARIVGPMTKEEKAVYDPWVAQKQELLAKLELRDLDGDGLRRLDDYRRYPAGNVRFGHLVPLFQAAYARLPATSTHPPPRH